MSLAEISQQDCEIQGWQPDINHQLILQQIQDLFYKKTSLFSSIFRRSKTSTMLGCYIWGDVGRGKTYLMDLFFNNSYIEKRIRLHFTAFMQRVHQELKSHNGDLIATAKSFRQQYDLICLDEFQVTEIADAMILARLFESLFDQGIHFVTTSNIQPDNLYKDGLHYDRFSPFVKVLKKHLQVIHLDSQNSIDYRRQDLEKISTFNPQTYSELHQQFLRKLKLEGHSGLKLTVHGRVLIFPEASNQTLWVDFKDICEVPYGPGEYQAIAKSVSHLFLVNVPILTADQKDSAKRFMTLIDCLYDEGVRLHLHAAADPDNLYQDTKTSKLPFDRTASRLTQMAGLVA